MTYSDQFNIRSRFVKFNDVADAIDGLITRQNAPNTTGTSSAYAISPLPTWDSVPTGSFVVFVPHLTNGSNATLTVNNIGPSPLLRGGVAISAGTMLAGVPYLCLYNGIGWEVLSSTEVPASRFLPITLDQTNNRVGINQTTPMSALHVMGTATYSGETNVSAVFNATSSHAGVVVGSINGNSPYLAAGKLLDGTGGFTPLRLRTSNTDRITIETDGNVVIPGQVAIGYASPSYPLHVSGVCHAGALYTNRANAASQNTSGVFLHVDGNLVGGMQMIDTDNELSVFSASTMKFYTGGVNKASLSSDGYGVNGGVYINNNHNANETLVCLRLLNAAAVDNAIQQIQFNNYAGEAAYINCRQYSGTSFYTELTLGVTAGRHARFSSNGAVNFLLGAVDHGGVDTNGYWYLGTSGTQSSATSPAAVIDVASGRIYRSAASSERYKTDIRDYSRGLTDLLALRPVFYKLKEPALPSDARELAGFIAEDIEAAGLSEYVLYDELERPDSLNYSYMVTLTCKAIQELNHKVEELKARLDNL